MTREMIKKELSQEVPANCYPREREVLALLCNTYDIEVKDFYKVLVNRKNSLKDINTKLQKKNVAGKTVETPSFYALLISVMDYEHDLLYRLKIDT
jgi:hypothetical protein